MNDQDISNLNPYQLQDLIKRGIVRVMLPNTVDLNSMTKYDQPEYQKFSHLHGVAISICAAGRKYRVAHPTISRWVRRGYITVIGKDKNKVMIDESDIAYCSEIIKSKSGSGHWLFNSDGTPYIKKSC
jgi:hypothetical protein